MPDYSRTFKEFALANGNCTTISKVPYKYVADYLWSWVYSNTYITHELPDKPKIRECFIGDSINGYRLNPENPFVAFYLEDCYKWAVEEKRIKDEYQKLFTEIVPTLPKFFRCGKEIGYVSVDCYGKYNVRFVNSMIHISANLDWVNDFFYAFLRKYDADKDISVLRVWQGGRYIVNDDNITYQLENLNKGWTITRALVIDRTLDHFVGICTRRLNTVLAIVDILNSEEKND